LPEWLLMNANISPEDFLEIVLSLSVSIDCAAIYDLPFEPV
jgi:hypothetical protein